MATGLRIAQEWPEWYVLDSTNYDQFYPYLASNKQLTIQWVGREGSHSGACPSARVACFTPQVDCAARISSVQRWLSFPSFPRSGHDAYSPLIRSNATP